MWSFTYHLGLALTFPSSFVNWWCLLFYPLPLSCLILSCPAIGCWHLYLTNSFKLRSKITLCAWILSSLWVTKPWGPVFSIILHLYIVSKFYLIIVIINTCCRLGPNCYRWKYIWCKMACAKSYSEYISSHRVDWLQMVPTSRTVRAWNWKLISVYTLGLCHGRPRRE